MSFEALRLSKSDEVIRIREVEKIGVSIAASTKDWAALRKEIVGIIGQKPDIGDSEAEVGYSDVVSDLLARIAVREKELVQLVKELDGHLAGTKSQSIRT